MPCPAPLYRPLGAKHGQGVGDVVRVRFVRRADANEERFLDAEGPELRMRPSLRSALASGHRLRDDGEARVSQPPYPKTKHRFTLADEPFMCIAGLWRLGEGDEVPTFTMLTTAPGPDVAPYHDRQVAALKPEDWAHWISLTRPTADT